MLSRDPKINRLILKWANNIFGTWTDVEKDLMRFAETIREEEQCKYSVEALLDKEVNQYEEENRHEIVI